MLLRAQTGERYRPHEGKKLEGIGYHEVSQTSACKDWHLERENKFDSSENGRLQCHFEHRNLIGKGAIPIPSTGSLLIMHDEPSIVPVEVKQPPKVRLLFERQFKEGVKRQEPTFLVVSVVY